MPRTARIFLPLVLIAMTVAGCDLVGDILEFGFWTGVVVVGLIVMAIWAIARALRRRPRP